MCARPASFLAVLAVTAVFLVPAAPAPASGAPGVFSFTCGLSHRLKDDPIVFPDQPGAAHFHDFYGNRTADAFSTYESMLGADTTCKVDLDSAGYWSPSLIRPNGIKAGIQVITLYYRGERGKTVAFPPDLRLIAGATVGTPTGTGGLKLLGWKCTNQAPLYVKIPSCPTNVKAIVTFPQCWDGEHLDVPDHHSHMAYIEGSKCPTSHPVMLPRVAVHVTYTVKGGPGFHLSSDMTTAARGRSLHADFWNTWDQDELERLVAECINGTADCENLET